MYYNVSTGDLVVQFLCLPKHVANQVVQVAQKRACVPYYFDMQNGESVAAFQPSESDPPGSDTWFVGSSQVNGHARAHLKKGRIERGKLCSS